MYLLHPPETRSKQASLKVPKESLRVLWRQKEAEVDNENKKKHLYPRSNGLLHGEELWDCFNQQKELPPMTYFTGSPKV